MNSHLSSFGKKVRPRRRAAQDERQTVSVIQTTGAARLASPFGWEQHCCLPLQAECDIDPLRRYLEAGVSYLSVNVGSAPHGIDATMRVLSSWRRQVLRKSESFALATSVDDILAAQQEGRLAVGFDLEDTNPLGGEIGMIGAYYDLGVRSMVLTYNSENQAGFGCHAPEDTGLKSFGRAVVDEMNQVGMMVDVSHCGYRTSMQAIEHSASPVIFSHSSMRAVWDHERNIRDDQARACAATGGVIGIVGFNIFLGDNDSSVQAMARHIDYAVELVGPAHVGIGTDYVFDSDDANREFAENPQIFPESYRRAGRLDFFPPERLAPLEAELSRRGYPVADIAAIMGGNFLRMAQQVWKPGPDGQSA
jgi:membrane dipeptidase